MALEDALLSIKNSLPTYAHLPIDEIYYDVQLCPVEDRSVNALILYARRSDMEGYLSAFDDTGHRLCLFLFSAVIPVLTSYFQLSL